MIQLLNQKEPNWIQLWKLQVKDGATNEIPKVKEVPRAKEIQPNLSQATTDALSVLADTAIAI